MSECCTNVTRRVPGRRALLVSAIVAVAVSAFPAVAGAATPPTGRQIRATILRAVEALKRAQRPDGRWPDYAQKGGVTALVVYAMLQAGVSPEEKRAAAALEVVRRLKNESTYVVSLKVLALAAADPARYKTEIQTAVDWLVGLQHATGAWGYGRPPPSAIADLKVGGALQAARSEAELQRAYQRPDASNTQFAILALSEAGRAGARVPADLWRKADRHFRSTQLLGGGWGYVYHDPDPSEAYGSITAAVVASLQLCHERLAGQESSETTAERLAAIERGIEWIAQHYTLKENPNRELAWYYFWLYALERAGVTSGRRTFGDHDWFREGTALLARGQRGDGRWTDRLYHDALCLLFLAKGFKPLLVQRLEWQGKWRRDPRDLDHLVRFLGKRVGGDRVDWRSIASDSPLSDYLAAPVLHVTGKGALRMLAASVPRLKAYVEQGGLILFDAQGGDAAFTESVRRMMAEQFPGAALAALEAGHPLARAVHRLTPKDIEIMAIGCRTAVVLAPKGIGDAWAKAHPDRANEALRFGENLAAYATAGQRLPDRLSVATILEMPPDEPPVGDTFRVGQIQHDGDWRPRPFAVPAVLKDLADRFGVPVYNRPVPVRLTDPNLGTFAVLYLTGHHTFSLSDAERAALKTYLEQGGFVWAHACCGRVAFDKAVRDLVADLFPDAELEELPPDHAMYSGKVGTRIEEVDYSPAVKADLPKLDDPVLFGLERGGHLVMVYSPYGLADGLDGIKTFGARTVAPDDARRLAINILLYTLEP
jgi:hypothetical protein